MVNKYLLLLSLAFGNLLPHRHPHPHPGPHSHSDREVPEASNNQPVLGILSLPVSSDEEAGEAKKTYIASSYVKYLEMAGARVIPLRVNHSFEELESLTRQLNGVLFTGGGADIFDKSKSTPTLTSDYAEKGCFLFDLIKTINDDGTYMPLWATCLGFELIHVCTNLEFDTLGSFNGEPPHANNAVFQHEALGSYIFNAIGSNWGRKIINNMAKEKIALLSHSQGVSPLAYQKYSNLTDFFSVLATMYDKSDSEYVAMVEAKSYPIFATQFHPEKNLFEWNTATIPHSLNAIEMATYFSNFFVNEARRNENSFKNSTELTANLIYNWPPLFIDGYFETVYNFE